MEKANDIHFFDAHTHAQFSAYDIDRKEIMDRAFATGVFMVNVGTQKDASRMAVELSHEYERGVYAAIGLHPIHTEKSHNDVHEFGDKPIVESMNQAEEFDLDYYKTLVSDPNVVAIGECGLDYYHLGEESKLNQKRAFEAQIDFAHDTGKPLMIHCRDAFDDMFNILMSHRNSLPSQNIAHSFVRTIDEAKKLLDLGFYFTFAGNITFKPRADKLAADDVIKFIPMDRLLTETDAPYLAPIPYRGKRNEPVYIVEVVKKMAEIKGIGAEEMKEAIWNNARQVFGLDAI